MVLATDEVYTYAILNYITINWSAHTEAGGDTTGGEGGVPAYVSIHLMFFFFIEKSQIIQNANTSGKESN